MDFIVLLLYGMSLFICALLQAEFSSLGQKKNWAENDFLYVWKASHIVINLQRVRTQLCRLPRLYEVFQRLQCFGFLAQNLINFSLSTVITAASRLKKMGVIYVLHLIQIVFSPYYMTSEQKSFCQDDLKLLTPYSGGGINFSICFKVPFWSVRTGVWAGGKHIFVRISFRHFRFRTSL